MQSKLFEPSVKHKLLSNVFNFSDATDQTPPVTYMAHMLEFLMDEESNNLLPPQSVQHLREVVLSISGPNDMIEIHWYCEYGCAIIVAMRPTCEAYTTKHFHVVGLDNWNLSMNVYPNYSEYHTQPNSSQCVYAGCALADKYDHIMTLFHSTLFEAKENTGRRRSAAGSKLGHQKTPGFILGILKACLIGKPESALPTGGFTDVGLHTGGKPRATSWPLLIAVCRAVLALARLCPDSNLLPDEFECCYQIYLLEIVMKDAMIALASRAQIDLLTAMLDVIVSNGVNLVDKSGEDCRDVLTINPSDVASRCDQFRTALIKWVSESSNKVAETYILPDPGDTSWMNVERLSFRIENVEVDASPGCSVESLRKKAEMNLGIYELVSRDTNLSRLNEWIHVESSKVTGSDGHTVGHMILHAAESIMFERMASGNYFSSPSEIETMISNYRETVQLYRALPIHEYRTKMILRTNELLMIWCAYCMIDAAVRKKHPQLMNHFGVSLNEVDLHHCVVSDRHVLSALIAICAYLRAESCCGNPVFSHHTDDATFLLALEYSESSTFILQTYDSEVKHAEKLIDNHWRDVVMKKKSALRLKGVIREYERKIDSLMTDVDLIKSRDKKSIRRNFLSAEASSLIHQLEGDKTELNKLREQLMIIEQSPTPVILPLPSVRVSALQWLFFLYLPPDFAILGRTSFMAQQYMLCGIDIELIKIDKFATEIHHHYNACSHNKALPISDVDLYSYCAVPKKIGPAKIDGLHSCMDGVFYPDNFDFQIGWNGGRIRVDKLPTFCNVFVHIPRHLKVKAFTDSLPQQYASLQVALHQYDRETARNRGNWGLANQHLKPPWMTKAQYLCFTSLRAYPNLQLRKLCGALHDRLLPLNHDIVHILIRQSIYHVGPLNTSNDIFPVWHTDQYHKNNYLNLLETVLYALIDEHIEKPRDRRSLFILLEITSYFSQWHLSLRKASLTAARSLISWTKAVDDEATYSGSILTKENKTLQCLYYGYAIIAIGPNCVVDRKEASVLCQCVLLMKQKHLDIDTKYTHEMSQVKVLADYVMNAQIHNILDALGNDASDVINESLHCLMLNLPLNLQWHLISIQNSQTQCFEALDDGNLYSLNLVTGIMLINGYPPGRLPLTITTHALYERTFGDTNFETFVLNDGSLQTINANKGCEYKFHLTKQNVLSIVEHENSSSVDLLLLNGVDASKWGVNLPIRLQKLYSHWYCKECDTIVVRGIMFSDKNIYYIILNSSAAADAYRVPRHLISQHWLETLSAIKSDDNQFDRLVINESVVSRVLSKFEYPQFIHFYLTNDFIKACFPRYSLEFLYKDGVFQSLDHAGYHLATHQQLNDTLFEFCEYLVLQSESDMKLLVPDGLVRFTNGALSCTNKYTGDAARVELRANTFTFHPRFQNLTATSICSRLQLAALYAATSTLLHDFRVSMTGEEHAMELVRQCWVNRPLTAGEVENLKSITTFSFRLPGLAVLCLELFNSSNQLFFLFDADNAVYCPIVPAEIGSRYELNEAKWNIRNKLSWAEIERMGLSHGAYGGHPRIRQSKKVDNDACVVLSKCPVDMECVKNVQADLESLIELVRPAFIGESFEISPPQLHDSALGNMLVTELKESSREYASLAKPCLRKSIEEVAKHCRLKLADVTEYLQQTELYLLESINALPFCKADNNLCDIYRSTLLKCSTIAPICTKRDFLRIADDCTLLHIFNCWLSTESCTLYLDAVIQWLELCVMQDKLSRLLAFCSTGSVGHVIQEIQVYRNWNSREHPEWLVFEAENQLQIRPQQYMVYRAITENPGALVQMNMGEGKTRVILPMIILSNKKSKSILRIHLLSKLLSDGVDYLHRTITAATASRKLFLLPFHRDVTPTIQSIALMKYNMLYCISSNGALIVAPEHRLSLQLKVLELHHCGNEEDRVIAKELHKLEQLPFRDILDECDELLHHRYQVIYSIGTQQPLEALYQRCIAIEAVLDVINCDTRIRSILVENKICHVRMKDKLSSSSFVSIRLLSGEVLDTVWPNVLREIATVLVLTPPHALQWMKCYSSPNDLIDFIVDSNIDIDADQSISLKYKLQWECHEDDLLVLRGILAGGILEHCLKRRHRVDYGVCRPHPLGRKMAVPFRANDTPTLRAEFAQPDVAIVFSVLSYYFDGLTREELIRALSVLLNSGPRAQSVEYTLWFSRSRPDMTDEDACKIDTVEKIDVSNEAQLDMLHKYYKYNTKAIDYWLNNCMFPDELKQFPERIVKNSWDLCNNLRGQTSGFSGTNDNMQLMPLQVHQEIADHPSLTTTNGKMMKLVSDNERYIAVSTTDSSQQPLWARILDLAMKLDADALIDAGALLAGINNIDAVKYVLNSHHPRYANVVYFDIGRNMWYVRDVVGREWPHHSSPVRERDAFVIFDESRCRGADMKLKQHALALLTLGPRMPKDVLMQAAGRMRQLDKGQKLVFCGGDDVTRHIIQCNAGVSHDTITSKHILQWVLVNTFDATVRGLFEWSQQGAHFIRTINNWDVAKINENNLLSSMYQSCVSTVPITFAFLSKSGYNHDTISDAPEMMQRIYSRVRTYGGNHQVNMMGIAEEAERELEQEEEKEEEHEREIAKADPRSEVTWDYRTLLSASSAKDLPSEAAVEPLCNAVARYLTDDLGSINWKATSIYTTRNFIESLECKRDPLSASPISVLNDYLRPVDAIVYLQDDTILLLSDMEANAILSLIWKHESTEQNLGPHHNIFVNFFELRSGKTAGCISTANRPYVLPKQLSSPDDDTLALQLFNGECTYQSWSGTALIDMLRQLLRSKESLRAALKMVTIRGYQHMLSHSDLEMFEQTNYYS